MLSKMQKRAALTLQVDFQARRWAGVCCITVLTTFSVVLISGDAPHFLLQYRRGGDEQEREGRRGGRGGGAGSSSGAGGSGGGGAAFHALAAVLGGERRAVVIGGAASVPSQLRGRGGGSRGNLHEALQASVESAAVESAVRASQAAPGGAAQQQQQQQQQQREEESAPAFSEANFPSVSGAGGSAAVGGRWAGAATGGVGGMGLRAEDFPALPGGELWGLVGKAAVDGGVGMLRVHRVPSVCGWRPAGDSINQLQSINYNQSITLKVHGEPAEVS